MGAGACKFYRVSQALDAAYGADFKERLLARSEVRKAFGYLLGTSLLVNEANIFFAIVEDTSQLEGAMLINGRYPRHDNEIALGALAMETFGIRIDDVVTIGKASTKKEFLVTGAIQMAIGLPYVGMITDDGLLGLQPDFAFRHFKVYLNDGVDAKAFVEGVRKQEGERIEASNAVQDFDLGTTGDVFAALAVLIVSATVIVVILVLYMVIKSTIVRRKRELGIEKAIGFTTFQLMNHIALALIPVVVVGVIIGAIGGYFSFNPIFIVFARSQGIVQVKLPIPLDWTVIVCVVLIVVSYVVSMLIAWRIRKISAYSLVRE